MKKVKFRLSSDSLFPYCLAMTLSLIGGLVSASLFYQSLFQTSSRKKEAPVAVIMTKTRTVQRKMSNRVRWDRLTAFSPVYNGDTLHTAALSSVTLRFENGALFSLAENTMAQVFRQKDGSLLADLSQGSALVDTRKSGDESGSPGVTASPLSLTLQGNTLTVTDGSLVEANAGSGDADAGKAEALVEHGEVQLLNGDRISSGNEVVFQNDGIVDLLQSEAVEAPSTPLFQTAFFAPPVADESLPPLLEELSALEADRGVQEAALLEADAADAGLQGSAVAGAGLQGMAGAGLSVASVQPQEKPAAPEEKKSQLPPTVATVSYAGATSADTFEKLRLGIDAFSRATVLVTLDLSAAHFTTIPAGAFSGCSRLAHVILPASLRHIEEAAFADCPIFTVVEYAGSEEGWRQVSVEDEAVNALLVRCWQK